MKKGALARLVECSILFVNMWGCVNNVHLECDQVQHLHGYEDIFLQRCYLLGAPSSLELTSSPCSMRYRFVFVPCVYAFVQPTFVYTCSSHRMRTDFSRSPSKSMLFLQFVLSVVSIGVAAPSPDPHAAAASAKIFLLRCFCSPSACAAVQRLRQNASPPPHLLPPPCSQDFSPMATLLNNYSCYSPPQAKQRSTEAQVWPSSSSQTLARPLAPSRYLHLCPAILSISNTEEEGADVTPWQGPDRSFSGEMAAGETAAITRHGGWLEMRDGNAEVVAAWRDRRGSRRQANAGCCGARRCGRRGGVDSLQQAKQRPICEHVIYMFLPCRCNL
jgi:hypothetical protein